MNDIRAFPFGLSPWPTSLGNQGNTSAASFPIRATGGVLWSEPISERTLRSITVAEDGCVFATSVDTIKAIEPQGTIRWQRETATWFGEAVALADRSLALATKNQLVCLDQDNGEIRWSIGISGCRASRPSVTPRGHFICKFFHRDGDRGLCCVSPQGGILWSSPLSKTDVDWIKPLVLSECFIVEDGSYLAGLDYDGKLRWLANRHGFTAADEASGIERRIKHERFASHPMQMDDARIAIGCAWWEDHQLLIFDLDAKSVSEWPGTSLRRIPHSEPLTLLTKPRNGIAGSWLGDIQAYDSAGNPLFESKLPGYIRNVISDSEGKVVVLTTVSSDYWEKYKIAYQLQEEGFCSLRGFDSDGNRFCQWNAPEPLESLLAVGKAGELYCATRNRLWAVG